MVNVAVVDDDANVRTGLKWLLDNVVGLRCSGTYATMSGAMCGLAEQPPDVLLLDVSLPDISGLDGIRMVRTELPSVKIIMHSNYDEEDKIVRSIKAGASGYVLKNASAPMLHDAIFKVYRGDTVWPGGYVESPSSKEPRPSLLGTVVEKLRTFLFAVRSHFGTSL